MVGQTQDEVNEPIYSLLSALPVAAVRRGVKCERGLMKLRPGVSIVVTKEMPALAPVHPPESCV